MVYQKESVKQIDVEDLENILDKEDSKEIVIDIREYDEYIDGHIPGVPLIPMSEIANVVDELDEKKEYIFVCRSGRRSHEVAKFFKMKGIENTANYAGGMLEWRRETESGETNIIKDVKDLYK